MSTCRTWRTVHTGTPRTRDVREQTHHTRTNNPKAAAVFLFDRVGSHTFISVGRCRVVPWEELISSCISITTPRVNETTGTYTCNSWHQKDKNIVCIPLAYHPQPPPRLQVLEYVSIADLDLLLHIAARSCSPYKVSIFPRVGGFHFIFFF
jgi:hypothetical protein